MARYFNPFAQYFTNAGRVVPGAKLFFYVNGTTTPKSTFSDAALTTVNPNPVICDAAGRIPPIFGPDGEYYSVTFTDANDVQIDQGDDISFVDSNVSSSEVAAALSGNTGALIINGTSLTINPPTTIDDTLDTTGVIRIKTNNVEYAGRNAADTTDIPIVKVNASDRVEIDTDAVGTVLGGTLIITGVSITIGSNGSITEEGGGGLVLQGSGSSFDVTAHNNGGLDVWRIPTGTRNLEIAAGNLTVNGDCSITGALSKGSGSFDIDHPIKVGYRLVHSFVESPRAENLYSGMVELVDGKAQVNIDTHSGMTEGTYAALNHTRSWSSSNESGFSAVKCSMNGNILSIECEDSASTDTVYFEVRGERKDQHMLETSWTDDQGRVIVEPLKPSEPEADPELSQQPLQE